MIKPELAKNILNNLLDIDLSTSGGSLQEQEDVINSDYVQDNGREDHPLSFFITNCTVDEEASNLDTGYYTSYSGTSSTDRHDLGTFNSLEADSKRAEIEAYYGPAIDVKIEYSKERIRCFLPITADFTPESVGGATYLYPVGFSTEHLNDFLKNLEGLSFTGVVDTSNHIDDGPQNETNGIGALPQLISDKAEEFATKVLRNTSLYAGSSKMKFYNVELNAGKENKEEIKVQLNYICTVYKKRTETHYYKYTSEHIIQGTTRTITFECTRVYYDKQTIPLTPIIYGWFYSQMVSTLSYFPQKAYIGLFTDYNPTGDTKNLTGMPSADGTGFREPPYKDGANYTYQRMSLHQGLFSDKYVFNVIEQIPITAQNYAGYAYLNNKEIIMFPEILNEDGWGNIYGFGIFENEVPVEGEVPYFWGFVAGAPEDPVETQINHVPLFRPNQFEVFLG